MKLTKDHQPVVIIEDNLDDADAITAALASLIPGGLIRHFTLAAEALEYLLHTQEQPLLILSDIRMPGMDGLTLQKRIQATAFLRRKSIPFIFLTHVAHLEVVCEAYDLNCQGYFLKEKSFSALRDQLFCILAYWSRSRHPREKG